MYTSGVEDERVDVVMTLTVPGPQVQATIAGDAQAAIRSLDRAHEVEMGMTFEPHWTLDRLSPEARVVLGR